MTDREIPIKAKSDNDNDNNEDHDSSNTKYCSNCGKIIDVKAEICPKCGVRVSKPPSEKSPGLAAILSFLCCGLGQIYNGEIGKGIAMLIVYVICLCLSILILPIIFALILWIYGIYDAYNTAKEINLYGE
jgi:TM2 domain-containing membrane protein YozV